VSATATTLVAALAGLLGATIGALLSGRQQRSAQLRDRMLDVALEYVEALREAVPDAPMEPRPELAGQRAALERARKWSHRAVLLFGPDSPAGEQAIEAYFATLSAFDHAKQPLDVEERLGDGESTARSIWLADHERIEGSAERAVDRFAYLAGRAIRSGGRHPWLDHGRRLRRQVLDHLSPRRRTALRDLRWIASEGRAKAEELKRVDAQLRRALDEAEAQGLEIPRDLGKPGT